MILLGHPETTHWIIPLLQNYPLQLTKEPAGIVNLDPRTGETTEYFPEGREDSERPTYEYSVISTVPGEDKAHRLPEEHEQMCADSRVNGPTH